jgi:DNA-directed RNA polymerase subunit alpha
MPATTLPRSALVLTGADRPTFAQVRALIRAARQDADERSRLAAVLADGIPGTKDKVRSALLALALGRHGDADEALEGTDLKKDAYAQAVMGLILTDLEEWADARTTLLAAVKGCPDARSDLVRALLGGGLLDEADKAAAGVEGAEGEFLQALVLEAKGQIEAAIKALEAALESDPAHIEAAFKLGVLLDRIGDDDIAAEHYLVCADAIPAYIPAVINLGMLYEERGEANAAVDCFRQALAYNPQDGKTRSLLRDAQASRKMYYDEVEEREREKMEKIMRTSVNDFELSVRSRNCLAKMNIFTLGDLLRISEPEMLSYKNFGETSLKEVREMLAARNLRLGMYRDDTDRAISKADQKVLGEHVERLELMPKHQQILEGIGVGRIGDLAQYSDLDLYKVPGCGQSFIQDLATALGAYGVALRKPDVRG